MTFCWIRRDGRDGVWHDDPECWSHSEPMGTACDCPDNGADHGRDWKDGRPTKPCRELVRVDLPASLLDLKVHRLAVRRLAILRLCCDTCGCPLVEAESYELTPAGQAALQDAPVRG